MKPGHVSGISEAATLNPGPAGDPEAGGLERTQMSTERKMTGKKTSEGETVSIRATTKRKGRLLQTGPVSPFCKELGSQLIANRDGEFIKP